MDEKEIKKRAFGQFVRERRTNLGLSNREVSAKLNISSCYLTDIEKGNRRAPLKHLPALEEVLMLEKEELDKFYDLAYQTHGSHPDINEYLSTHPNARLAVRLARDKGLSGEEFLNIVLNFAEKDTTEEEIEK